MNVQAYIAGLLEELRAPKSKEHEDSIRAELTRHGVEAPKTKATKVADQAPKAE